MVLAGGEGKRLLPLTNDRAKPAVPFGGTLAVAVPSPAHQVAFDLRTDAPSAFRLEPPAFAVHHYVPDAGMTSHHVYVDEGAGPYPFYEPTGELVD